MGHPGIREDAASGVHRLPGKAGAAEGGAVKYSVDVYGSYEDWERRMGNAADSAGCQRPDMPDGNSADCPCAPCGVAFWWDHLEGLEKGVLFAGMVQHGFRWTRRWTDDERERMAVRAMVRAVENLEAHGDPVATCVILRVALEPYELGSCAIKPRRSTDAMCLSCHLPVDVCVCAEAEKKEAWSCPAS